MEIVVEEAKARGLMSQRDGRTYYFCSNECKKTFETQKPQIAQ
jgi:YHS domain-containing protein